MRSVITNTSGSSKYMGFVPPHGVEVADGGTVTVDGDIRSILAGGRGRYGRGRELDALDEALTAGDITVVNVEDDYESSSSS